MKKTSLISVLKELVNDLAKLKLPATATSVVALIIQFFPVHLNGELVAGVVAAVGVIGAFIQKIINTKKAPSLDVTVKTVEVAVDDVVKAVDSGTK